MTPELIGILAVGATMIGLLLAFWRDARADIQALRVEVNAGLAELRGGLADLRKDLQALTERVSHLEGRMSRLEGVIEGLFARRADRDRHDAAA